MSEPKDPAIKLFGKTIPLPEISQEDINTSTGVCGVGGGSQDQDRQSCGDPAVPDEVTERGDEEERESDNKDSVGEKATKGKPQDTGQNATLVEQSNSEGTSVTTESAKTPSAEKESTELKTSKTEEEQSDTSNLQEKTPKKPDTVLPCPRCNSMDTKFCYYNNYNVNQPRHYCKNCQRYWTAGGTMRNVPVGAGRRKNKNSASHYRHVTVSEALQNGQSDVPNGVHHPILKTNSTVVAFGADTPLHESMASALNLTDKTMQNCTRNGFLKPEALSLSVSHGNQDNHSNVSAVPTSGSNGEACKSGSQEPVVGNCQGFPPQLACFPGTPWPYPWDTAQWSPTVTPPAFYPPGFAVPFYPAAACWGSTVPGSWNIPWLPQPSSPKQTAANSGPNSPTLGKHLRDENMPKSSNSVGEESVKDNNSERCLWIPKTLRIGDPREAAKSSILTSLGIKNDKAEAIGGQGLLKAFQSKGDGKICMTETSSILKANPAALSRSLQFHESS